jgi:hypothetical protein
MRMPGRPGGRMGGPGGLRRGSIAGAGASRWNGLMIIGGTVGGADGGPLGPLFLVSCMVNCMASPCDRAGCQYRQRIAIYKAKSASPPAPRPSAAVHAGDAKNAACRNPVVAWLARAYS